MKAVRSFREQGKSGYLTNFRLAGVGPQDPPSTRVIGPVWENIGLGEDQSGEAQYADALVVGQKGLSGDITLEDQSAREMAQCLLTEWTVHALGMTGEGYGKGVWICAGKKPSPDEINGNRERQAGWARFLVDYADSLWLTDKRQQVTRASLFREAATWVGEDRPWVHIASTATMKACPFCGQTTSAGAPVCRHCGRMHDPELMYEIEHKLKAVTQRVEAQQAKYEAAAAKEAAEAASQQSKDFSARSSTMKKSDKMAEMRERMGPTPDSTEEPAQV
jgi:hypothetical protein